MLTPEYLEQVGSDLSDLYYDLETEIIADIAERLKINGDRMTTTAEYLVMKLEQMGYQHEYVQRRLASIMNISEQKVSQILEDSTYQSMRDSLQRAKTYESVDGSSISFDEQILQSKTAINAELKNLTNSTARMATNTMLRTFDNAYMKVSSGAYSLNQAVDQAIKELIDTGIGQVTYRSGTKRNIDTAVRVAVRTGVNQNALKCEEQLLEATEHNLVVVSAHMGARPSHAEWQGKIYWRDHPEGDYENFEEATGYGTGAGLGGWNCRHQFFAYYPEMGNPYEDVDTTGNQKVYELTQQQRYNERMIRKWKRRKTVYEKAGLDTTLENQKIREWTERNNALIKSSKYLKRQYANEKSYRVNLSKHKNDIDLMGKKVTDIIASNKKRIAYQTSDVNPQIYRQTYSKNSKKMETTVNSYLKKNNIDVDVYILKNKDLGGLSAYNHASNKLYISEELCDQEKFAKLTGNRFPAKTVNQVLDHEIKGHKAHWSAVRRFNKNHPKLNEDEAKNDLESNLRKFIAQQQNSDVNYLTKTVSQNANIAYEYEGSLNEVIADAIVLIEEGNLSDKTLEKLVKDVIEYDA